ncbi:Zinc finger FYVE/PHD-type [Penicillium verhagenii]|nr:Zinc finger FYVE/PHD-type [Penicillium verhagenii]
MMNFQAPLTTVYNDPTFVFEDWSQVAPQYPQQAAVNFGETPSMLPLKIELPTTMYELQQRFFMDFVLIWRGWFDDPFTWNSITPTFRAFSMAFLRLAAWDFEISKDREGLPVKPDSLPEWKYPKSDLYWFHGLLIVLHGDIRSSDSIHLAVERARKFLQATQSQRKIHCVLLSPMDIILVELSQHITTTTNPFPLVTNHAALESSPGFRLLAQIFSTTRWKDNYQSRENWTCRLPPELLTIILDRSAPRDAIALAQASFAFEESYYATLPQLSHIKGIENMFLSIPCCGKRAGLENGLLCYECLTWQHRVCIDPIHLNDNDWICLSCREGSTKLEPGGIHQSSYDLARRPHYVRTINGLMVPRLRFRKSAGWVAHGFNFVMRFDGKFSGLAYLYQHCK